LCNKSKKFTSIFNNKLNKRCFLLSNRVEKSWRSILSVITCMKVRIPMQNLNFYVPRGYDCVSYNRPPSRWKLRRGGVNEVLFGYSRDFPFQLTNITVVLRTRTYIFQGRNVNKYLFIRFVLSHQAWIKFFLLNKIY
jgi:hypothetical protein